MCVCVCACICSCTHVAIYKQICMYRSMGSISDGEKRMEVCMWVVVKIRVPVWVLIIVRHLLFRVPKKGP